MRLVFVCALVVSAFAARSSVDWELKRSDSIKEHNQFQPGYEYRFLLNTQTAHGLPVPGSEGSNSRAQLQVALSFSDSTTALLRVDKIRVASAQLQIDSKLMQPFELFEEVELSEENMRTLLLPVRFRYEQGMVSEIEFDKEDITWSRNLKRAVLNMLQVNVNQKNTYETALDRETSKDTETFFTAPERTIEGDCMTMYTVVPEGDKKQAEIRVTKSINFEKCEKRMGMRYSFRFGDECHSCENKYKGEERNIESSTVLNFRLRGEPSRFLIRDVELRSIYQYMPMNEKETFFTTTILTDLRLTHISQQESRIVAPKSEKKESLLYDDEWEKNEEKFMALGDESVLRSSPYSEVKNKPEVVERLVKSIISKSETEEKGVDMSSTHEMARLVRVLRMATKEELRRVHKEVCESEEHDGKTRQHMRDIINDALALAGTFNTVEHLVEKMKSKQIPAVKSALIFKQLTNIRVPSEKMINNVVSLCKEQSDRPIERQSCWLTVGALVNGLCGEQRDKFALESEEKKCPRQLKEKYVKEMFELFEGTNTRYEKVLALKTIANAGLDLSVFPLEQMIKKSEEEPTVRIQAIDALRKLRSLMPRKLQSVLLPVVKDQKEKPEVRLSAFHQLMQTVPERAVIDQIVEHLKREPSQQVYNFIHSALVQLSRSEIPCEKRMAEDIKASLKLIRLQPGKLLDSRYKHYNWHSEELRSGATLNWAAVFSNDSILPKELMSTFETNFAGQWNKYLAQLGFSQQNLDSAVYKFLEKVDEKGLEGVIVRGKRAASSSFRPTEFLENLFNKLSIKMRRQSEQDPHALVYIRFRDLDYAVLPIDEQVIPDAIKSIIKNGRIELGEIEQFLAKGYRFQSTFSTFIYERTRQIITSAGTPLVYSSKMPTVIRAEGLVQAEISPKNGKSFEGMRLRLETRPSMASTHITKVEVLSPLANFGIKLLHSVQANIPVDVVFEMNWEKKWEMQTIVRIPQQDRRLIQLSSRPVSFMRVWPKETRTYVESLEKTIFVDQLDGILRNIDHSFFEKSTGIKINVVGHSHGHIFERGMEELPSALLIGENNVEINFEKTEETPKEYKLKMEMENFNEEKKMEGPKMEKFFEDEKDDHFKVEEYPEYEEEEKERRGAFSKYVKSYNKAGKGYSHRVSAMITSAGGRKERKAEMELRTVCDEQMRHCTFEMDAERTPVMEERKNWKLTSQVEVLYPEMPESLEELLEQKHREMVATASFEWGSEEKNKMTMKVQGEQNAEQKKWMKRAIEMKERKSDEKWTALEEYSMLVEAAMLNQYKVVSKYEIESPVTLQLIDRLYSLLVSRSSLFSTEMEYAKNEPRVIRAVLTLEPETRQYANVSIETPRETVVIRDLRLPYPLRLVNIRRQPSSPIRSFSSLASALYESSKAECRVESRKVKSFDDVLLRTPLTTCYSVLAKDCSSSKPNFAILMKKVEKNSEEKKMKIVSKKHMIELEKRPEWENIKVIVNGEEVKKDERMEEFGVYKTRRDLVTVEMEDVTVVFDGYTTQIKMANSYKNKQCGICGHFDGDKTNELRRADYEETEDIEEVHRSYLVKEDKECEIEEDVISEKKNYGREEESSSSEEESIFDSKWEKKSKKVYEEPLFHNDKETIEPVEKTRVIEESNRVCFSSKPVPECPRNSYENEDDVKQKKISFDCLPRSSSEARRLVRESRRETVKVVDPVETITESVFVPKTCIVY